MKSLYNDLCFNPQFDRKSKLSLNGIWTFNSSIANISDRDIIVPYCPESKLSGIGYTGFITECEYTKTVCFTKENLTSRVIIHFGAVDYLSKLYVNGSYIGEHRGGYTHFSFDITSAVKLGENQIKVVVFDNVKDNMPSGKQSAQELSFGCFYTRTTGIWQPVWLEFVPNDYIVGFKFYPNVSNCSVQIPVKITDSGIVKADVYFNGKLVGSTQQQINKEGVLELSLSEKHLWNLGQGNLYDVVLTYGNDEVTSYFGLRSVQMDGYKFLLNGKSVFQRLVLDQGFYVDGIYTPSSIKEMQCDIDIALKFGFNGARLHQKVFDPIYLYLCDKAGYMVWGEFPSWGIDYSKLDAVDDFIAEWTEAVDYSFNHPSIVTWCPLNETWTFGENNDVARNIEFIDRVYAKAKDLDATRPVIDVSGGFHGTKTDIYDVHCYADVEELSAYVKAFNEQDTLDIPGLYKKDEAEYKYQKGQPVMFSEYGGIPYNIEVHLKREVDDECGAVLNKEQWGYGKAEMSFESFFNRYKASTEMLLASPKVSGFCYTQLYDIEQEQNGFCFYDRTSKFTEEQISMIANCNKGIAEIEK